MYHLQELKNQAQKDRDVPYIYTQFDICNYLNAIGNGTGNPLSRMRNSVALALNDLDKLPKYIVVPFDERFISLIENKFDAQLIINWLMRKYSKMPAGRKAKLLIKAIDPAGQNEKIRSSGNLQEQKKDFQQNFRSDSTQIQQILPHKCRQNSP